jgi:hypothetical protein
MQIGNADVRFMMMWQRFGQVETSRPTLSAMFVRVVWTLQKADT